MPYIESGVKFSSKNNRNSLIFLEPPIIEAPASIDCNSHFNVKEMGAYSFIRNDCILKNINAIGRFCSIAPGCLFGPEEHNTQMLTTSTLINSTSQWSYDDSFNVFWKENNHFLKKVRASLSSNEFKNNQYINIEHDVWIGQNVTIMRGIRIGTGAIIGANSVVTKDVPPYTIVAGVPAKKIKNRFPEETISKLIESQWWNYSLDSLRGIDFSNPESAATEITHRKNHGLLDVASYPKHILTKGK